MVKTRHSGDFDESLDNDFLSLNPRKTRARQVFQPEMNGYESEESGEVAFVRRSVRHQNHKDPIIDDTESDDENEDDEDDEEDSLEDEDDDNNESNNNNRRRGRKITFEAFSRAGKGTSRRGKSPARRGRKPSRSPGKHRSASKSPSRNAVSSTMNGDAGARRSSRQRKLTYGSFNEKDIDRHHHLVQRSAAYEQRNSTEFSSPERKRRRQLSEVDKLRRDAGQEIDMFGRSSRQRSRLQREFFGKKDDGETSQGDTEDTEGSTATETETESSSEDEPQPRGGYSLREHKPATARYMAPVHEPRRMRNRSMDMFRESTPPLTRTRKVSKPSYQSPARRRAGNFRRRSPKRSGDDRRRKAFHDSDSTSSDGSSPGGDSGDDERRFQRRKTKSMNKARGRLLPMNFEKEDVSTGILRDRSRAGASMADVDPMDIDRSVKFDTIGGLGKHLRKLKEMIVFPLMYPEVFDRFKIAPPRGVLFYGPPGTGKTLVARALANECSTGERKVAFFMRKGADCLSKWVGESERQLRLLFDQAYQMRPSVIFFDEIDGLAPVRSSKQDQIHSSLVSTLLALMDGLDNRGEIVVIGATNRIDSIDPALRRPGRFDREFLFPLPSLEARKQILMIHTKAWNPPVRSTFMEELATKTVGYCGADLKSLCTEAALHALRRRYPQIYVSNEKLQLDVSSIEVSAKDFTRAMDGIVPTAQRSASAPGRALVPCIKPLIAHMFDKALKTLMESFPAMQLAQMASLDLPDESSGAVDFEDYSDDDENVPSIYEPIARNGRLKKRNNEDETQGSYLTFTSNVGHSPVTHRPRMLLSGHPGQGQSSHVAPALLHAMEKLPVHTLDLPALYAVSVKTAEESCADVFREARRTSPSIVYMPHIGEWWEVITDTVRSTFMALLRDVEATMPLLLLATSEVAHSQLPQEIKHLFNASSGEVITMHNPTEAQRREYFQDILLNQTKRPPPTKKQAAQKALEVLPKAPPPEPRKLTDAEIKQLNLQEEATMRELRLFLRDTLNKLGRDRKFQIFSKPVDEEEVPDYYEIITEPMDLSTMMSKIDLHHYQTVQSFLDDIDLICRNALEYNPEKDPQSRAIRHRACTLKDTTLALMNAELDQDFERLCKEIAESRRKRGQNSQSTVPDYYFTKPLDRPGLKSLENCLPAEYRKRKAGDTDTSLLNGSINGVPKIRKIIKRIPIARPKTVSSAKKSPWCKPTRRRWKKITVFIDEHGNEIPNPDAPKDEKVEEGDSDSESSEDEDNDEANKSRSSPRGRGSSPRTRGNNTSPRGRSPRGSGSSPKSPGRGKSPVKSPSTRSHSPGRRSRSRSKSPGRSPGSRNRSKSPRRSSGSSPAASKSPRSKRGESPSRRRSHSPAGRASGKSGDEMDVDEDKAGVKALESPRARSARGRQKAAEVLHSQIPDVKVDEAHLRRLLDVAVRQTNNFNVEKLEKLFSKFTQCIYKHRYEPNKADLIKDLEGTLEKFCSSHW